MNWLSADLRKYSLGGWISLKSRFAYRAELVGPLLTYGLFVGLFALIWSVAYRSQGVLAGYTQFEVTWYFASAELMTFLGGGFYFGLSEEVKNGQIAYTLGRPYNYLLFQLSQNMGPALAQLPVLAPLGFLLCTLAVGPWLPSSILQVSALCLSVILTLSLHFFLQMTLSLAAFWVEETIAFFWIYQKIFLVTGTLMPLEFLPIQAQNILIWTPFPYLSWAPSKLLVHFNPQTALGVLSAQVSWVAIAAAAAGILFRIGVRRTTVQGG